MYSAGDVLKDRYTIRGMLGRGGSGCVYLAEDFGVGKLWALKEIEINNPDLAQFAKSEILMLKSLDHPCIPRITDAWQDEKHFYIVSDYIEGISLANLLDDGPLPKIKCYKLSHQIAETLEFLHKFNPPILYLDLKPDNIMVKPDGRLYLIDFGISSFVNQCVGGYGTEGYAAPEQYMTAGYPGVDTRSDIYAFGKTYLTMRTGMHPEPNAHRQAVIIRNCISISKSEKKFILSCTHVNPEYRYKSMSQVVKHLDQIYFFSRNIKQKIIIFLGILTVIFLVFLNISRQTSLHNYTADMLNEAAPCMENGEYSKEGLGVIAGYIESDKLSPAEADYYSFMLGRKYFETMCDYREAEHFFERLDESRYPEKTYYIELCKLQTGFDIDTNELSVCLESFMESVLKKPDEREKYENLIFIAFMYEHYLHEDNGGGKAKEIYMNILDRMDILKQEQTTDMWIDDIARQCKTELEVLNAK